MIKQFNLTISFGKSSSQYYDGALECAQEFPDFAPISDDQPLNVVTLDSKSVIDYRQMVSGLWSMIRNWKSARMRLNGHHVSESGLDQHLLALQCFRRYEIAPVQGLHCRISQGLEGWGCKLLCEISRHVPREPYGLEFCWFHCGHFITDNIWQVDKAEIKRILQRESVLKRLNFCSKFSLSNTLALVDKLPDQIDLSENDEWVIKHPDDITPGYAGGVCIEPRLWKDAPRRRLYHFPIFGNDSAEEDEPEQ